MSNSPHTYKLAAERGFKVIGMSSPPENLVSCWDAYADAESHDGTNHQRGDGVGVCASHLCC
jgi:hypothetical protein